MPVKILGLDFSPRENSNSLALLQSAFARLEQAYGTDARTEIVSLRGLRVEECLSCDTCGKVERSGQFIPCVQRNKDDVQDVLDRMVEADGLCVATPVHFGLPSALFSRFIMRTRVLRHQDFRLANRPVGVLATAARRSGGAETTIMATWLPFIRNGCLIVGNGNGTCQFGTCAWAGKRGDVQGDAWGLEQAFQTAERVFQVARMVQQGAAALEGYPPMRFSHGQGTRPAQGNDQNVPA